MAKYTFKQLLELDIFTLGEVVAKMTSEEKAYCLSTIDQVPPSKNKTTIKGNYMTPSAKRAKATLLVEWVAARLRIVFPEYEINVPKAHEHGEDLPLDPELRKLLPFSFEMKNQRGYAHLYSDMDQTIKNSNGFMPVLVVKAPYKSPLVVMRWEDFEKTLGV